MSKTIIITDEDYAKLLIAFEIIDKITSEQY